MGNGHVQWRLTSVHVDEAVEEVPPPTKKLCSCRENLSSLSGYHVRKHLAGSNHL